MRPRRVLLVVEPDERVRGVRRMQLELWGYRVLTAAGAAEALDVLRGRAPGSVDLLVTDLLLPYVNGNLLARQAKALHPGLPVLVYSATVTGFELPLEADSFLPAGTGDPLELRERVKLLMKRKRGPKRRAAAVPGPAADAGGPVQVAA